MEKPCGKCNMCKKDKCVKCKQDTCTTCKSKCDKCSHKMAYEMPDPCRGAMGDFVRDGLSRREA